MERQPMKEMGDDNRGTQVQQMALLIAVRHGNTEDVRIILDAGAESKTSDRSQNLIAVALQNYKCPTDLIELLLNHGVSPNDHDGQLGNIPLLCVTVSHKKYVQITRDDSAILQLLLQHGADPNVSYIDYRGPIKAHRTPLYDAVRSGSTEEVKILLDAGAECKLPGVQENPLVLALKSEYCPYDLIRLLLERGADPNDHEEGKDAPLVYAVVKKIRQPLEKIHLLLKYGANPNVAIWIDYHGRRYTTALHEAARQGWTEGVKILLEAGAKITIPGVHENPLLLAVNNYDCPDDLIKLLLEHGTDPNDQDEGNNAALVHAVTSHREGSGKVGLLLKYGANPNVVAVECIGIPDQGYTTALHEAARQGWTEGVRMLLEAGAKCVSSDRLQNPLVLALRKLDCPQEVIELLLKNGAVNCEVFDTTPLIHSILEYAALGELKFCNVIELLDLFFIHGGNINIEDGKHRTALQYAIIKGCSMNTLRWLIRHGAMIIPPHMPKQISMFYIPNPLPALLLLLQAGMRVSNEGCTDLTNMEVEFSNFYKKDTALNRHLKSRIYNLLSKLIEEEVILQKIQYKATFPEYCVHQMSDLQEFSNKSLNVYPEDSYHILHTCEPVLGPLGRVLEFLSEPQSLQWYCRCCVRENLVSLQPSVVKTLPLPQKMKAYILCHEI